MKTIKEKIDRLPPDYKREAEDFIEFLYSKAFKGKKRGRLNFNWEGGLEKFKDKYTYLELQKKSLEWWGD